MSFFTSPGRKLADRLEQQVDYLTDELRKRDEIIEALHQEIGRLLVKLAQPKEVKNEKEAASN